MNGNIRIYYAGEEKHPHWIGFNIYVITERTGSITLFYLGWIAPPFQYGYKVWMLQVVGIKGYRTCDICSYSVYSGLWGTNVTIVYIDSTFVSDYRNLPPAATPPTALSSR